MFKRRLIRTHVADANDYAAKKLKDMAVSLEEVSRAFSDEIKGTPGLTREDGLMAMQQAATLVCGSCNNCNLYSDSQKENSPYLCYILRNFEQNGQVYYEDMPRLFMESCRRQDEYMGQLNRNLGKATMNLAWKNRFLESRDAVVAQFQELAAIMEDFAGQMEHSVDITQTWEEKVRRLFRHYHLKLHHMLLLEYGNEQREAYLTMSAGSGRCFTTKEAAELLGRAMGSKSWVPDREEKNIVNRKPSMVRFVEEGKYMMLYGVARRAKEGEQVSGDNFTFHQVFPRQVIMSLSDGMGSGQRASEESRKVVELTEQLLETGFSARSALKLVNTVLLLTGQEQHPATLDFCCVDLHSGVLEAMKLGAVATFIIGEDGVEVLDAGDVPMGVLNPVEPVLLSKKLWNNNRIIMVSDGVLEALEGEDKELAMKAYLENLPLKTPQAMAERILEYALSCQSARDDMTVLAAGIWKK